MKKLFSVSLVLAVGLLFGCQEKNDGALDTSKLEKVEPEGLTEEMKKSVPVSYKVPSLEEGVDALPFTLNVPEDLPFDAKPFEMSIDDMKQDGKKLRVMLTSYAKDSKPKPKWVTITAHNFKVEHSGTGEEVKLSDKVVGIYRGGSLTFNKDGVYYVVEYMNEKTSDDEQYKSDVLMVAKQLL